VSIETRVALVLGVGAAMSLAVLYTVGWPGLLLSAPAGAAVLFGIGYWDDRRRA
jgi:hypothetical protein